VCWLGPTRVSRGLVFVEFLYVVFARRSLEYNSCGLAQCIGIGIFVEEVMILTESNGKKTSKQPELMLLIRGYILHKKNAKAFLKCRFWPQKGGFKVQNGSY
jgi:hypothetical protein